MTITALTLQIYIGLYMFFSERSYGDDLFAKRVFKKHPHPGM